MKQFRTNPYTIPALLLCVTAIVLALIVTGQAMILVYIVVVPVGTLAILVLFLLFLAGG